MVAILLVFFLLPSEALAEDPVPFTLSNLVIVPTEDGSTISWKTSRVGSSQVEYSLDLALGFNTEEIDVDTPVISHTVTLNTLVSCTQYRYRVVTRDLEYNILRGDRNTFTTLGCVGDASVSDITSAEMFSNVAGSLQLQILGKGVTFSFPPNSLASPANLFFQVGKLNRTQFLQKITPPEGKQIALRHLYRLGAMKSSTTTIDTLTKNLTVNINYNSDDIVGISESTLKIYRYHDGSWFELSGCFVNSVLNIITCMTPDIGTYILAGVAEGTSDSSSSETEEEGDQQSDFLSDDFDIEEEESSVQLSDAVGALSGRLIKYEGNLTVYLLQNGKKRAMTRFEIFLKNFQHRPIAVIPQTEIYPDGELLRFGPGSILKGSGDTIYLVIDDGSIYAFTSAEEFTRFGYQSRHVITISNDELNSYPKSKIVKLNYHATTNFIKYDGDPTVYMIENNKKRPLTSPQVFFSYAGDWSDVLTIPLDIVYANGSNLSYPEGAVIKPQSGSTVYLVEGRKRKALRSEQALRNRGYVFSQITEVPDTDLLLNDEGEEIE